MKSTFSLLALAAGASATFLGAPPFTCPGNSQDHCNPQQSSGFDWGSVSIGASGQFGFGGFDFNGWTCAAGPKKRYDQRRTSGKAIEGLCHPEPEKCPSFGATETFSIDVLEVFVEFDCDLEFHYSMPGGDTCKHRSPCSSKGSSVKNSQCGGATSVTVVYPSQTGKPKPSCSVTIPTVSFSCHTGTTTTKKTTTTTATTVATTKATTTTTSPATSVKTTTTTTTPSPTTTTTSPTTSPATTTATTTKATTSAAGTTSGFSNSTTSPAGSSSTTATTTTSAAGLSSSSSAAGTTTTAAGTTTTVAAGTTTTTAGTSTTSENSGVTSSSPGVSSSSPGVSSSSALMTTTTSSSPPENTGGCPPVVPQCLNTFLEVITNVQVCKDNTDTACYCVSTDFVQSIFECIYAHGETDIIVSEAISYFQGICAPYVPKNPCIATGAETITSYLTTTQTATVTGAGATATITQPGAGSTAYTTVTVAATTVVPCTDTAGSTIPGSSSTVTVQTTLTVPQITLPTASATATAGSSGSSGSSGSGSGSGSGAGAGAGAGSGSGAGVTTINGTPSPVATVGASSPTKSGSPFVTVNGGGRVSVGLGLVGAAFLAVLAL